MSIHAPVHTGTPNRITIAQGITMATSALDVTYTSVLGSCIAVCLHDRTAGVGGMNHFLLADPEPIAGEDPALMSRYGVHAMELLVNAMLQQGAQRKELKARVYGGASMRGTLGAIGISNIRFARTFLRNEDIPILGEDVGGNAARRVDFMPGRGLARSRIVSTAPPVPVIVPPPPSGGEVELF